MNCSKKHKSLIAFFFLLSCCEKKLNKLIAMLQSRDDVLPSTINSFASLLIIHLTTLMYIEDAENLIKNVDKVNFHFKLSNL